ncbi:MAG: dihydrodipicolinate synthase family protein, partial [Sulfitobacter sp.]
MTLFTGLSAFPLTPIDDEGQLKSELLQRFLERIVAAGADSIGLLGSTGGYAYLTPEERKRTLRAAVDCVAGRTPLVVGVGALTTDVAEDLARDARKAGADGLLLAPMSYQPLTDDEVFRHFEAVAAAGELPLCIYNNPGTTKFTFSPDLIARLAEISNVAAVKMPLPADSDYAGEMRSLRAVTPDGFAVGYSGDWGAKDALLAGGACWYSVVAGLLPEPALALTRASQAGNAAEAER